MPVTLPDPNKVPGDSGHSSDTNLIIEAINTLQSEVDNIPAGPQGPQGEPGTPGAQGANASVTIGSTNTGAAGSGAAVTNSGTAQDAIFNFTIPRGDTGTTGATGATGAQGPAGNNGSDAVVSIGTTTTGPEGSSAQVTNSGSPSSAVFNFTIPRGDTGPAANLSDSAPEDLGTAASGVAAFASRSDHVHGMPSAADVGAIATSARGAADGVASLDSGGKVPSSELPAIAITDTFVVASEAAMLALDAQVGDVAIRTDVNLNFILATAPASTLANWKQLLVPADSVTSVDGRTGVVTLSDLYDAAGDAAAAQSAAQAYADSLAPNYDASGSASAAQSAAQSYADGLAVNYDAAGSASAAQAAAQSYADGLAVNYDAAGAAAAVASDLSDHESATTTVHGISDTANLVYTSDARLSDQRTPLDGSVTTAKIVDANVTNAKLANDSITINGSAVALGGAVTISGLPDQTGNSGEYLTTDGTTASWAPIVTDPYPVVFFLGGM